MRFLLDHCVDRRFAELLAGALAECEVQTAAERGWEQLQNGELLKAAAEGGFEAFVTIDRNLRHQQNLSKLPLAVIEVNSPSSRLAELEAFLPAFKEASGLVATSLFIALYERGRIEVVAARPS